MCSGEMYEDGLVEFIEGLEKLWTQYKDTYPVDEETGVKASTPVILADFKNCVSWAMKEHIKPE